MTRALPLALFALCACPGPLPQPTDGGVDGGASTGTSCSPAPIHAEQACLPLATDYQPRTMSSSTDPWPACISDSNVYTPFDPNISTIARVTAFEEIATLLWRDGKRPSPQDFLDARVAYAVDQGLDSRVQRREDVHYAPAPMPCSTAGLPAQYPDRCAGPAKLLPILNDAFAKGATGEAALVNAARVEAALTWFLYLSSLSEVMTCTQRPQDCDSCWAYYSGGGSRETPLGLGKRLRELAPLAHDRAYDATLAVRCWRDLDNPMGLAMDTSRRDLAREQLDRALLRGVALVVRQAATELSCSTGDVREARFAFVTTLLPFFDRAARERGDAAQADVLAREATRPSADQLDVAALTSALDAVFPCP